MEPKKWTHLGSEDSGPKVAAIMTVIASAQRAGLNVREYLESVLQKLADASTTEAAIATMLPRQWQVPRGDANGGSEPRWLHPAIIADRAPRRQTRLVMGLRSDGVLSSGLCLRL